MPVILNLSSEVVITEKKYSKRTPKYIKGIVSRDLHMFLVPFDRSYVSALREHVVCFLNFVFMSNFSISHLGVMSLPCEWSWHLVPVRGSEAKYFSIGFTLKVYESRGCKDPHGLGHFSSSKFFRPNNICMNTVVDSQYGATTVAVESLIAQQDSKGKLTTPRRENQKF
jgi:hypothetical protein